MNAITCPRCGTENPANMMNCKQCQINLKFALEHPEEIERIRAEELLEAEKREKAKSESRIKDSAETEKGKKEEGPGLMAKVLIVLAFAVLLCLTIPSVVAVILLSITLATGNYGELNWPRMIAMAALLPAFVFGLLALTAFWNRRSIRQQMSLVRQRMDRIALWLKQWPRDILETVLGPEADVALKCERCNKETRRGSYYEFYYGKQLSWAKTSETAWKYTYSIAGSKRAWICNACVGWTWGLLGGVAGGASLIACVIGSLATAADDELGAVAGGCFLVLLGIAYLLFKFHKGGEKLAIEVYRSKLKGYDAFFTPEQYAKLEKQQR